MAANLNVSKISFQKNHKVFKLQFFFTEVRDAMRTFNLKVKSFTLWALLAKEQVDVR